MSVHILAPHNVIEGGGNWRAFGQNPAVGGTLENIWAFGGIHTEMTTAAALKVSSSSDSDTFVITVDGLDADWNPQTVTQALSGKTETTVGTTETWIRVFKIRNRSATPAVGDVYCYLDDTVAAGIPQTQTKVQLKMPIGYERSMATRLSVPAGKTGRILMIGAHISAASASEIRLMFRRFGEVPRVRRVLSVYFNGESVYYTIPLECAEKSDVYLLAKGNGAISGEINGFYESM